MPAARALPWIGDPPPAVPPARSPRRGRRRRAFLMRRGRRIAAALLVGLSAWLVLGVVDPPPPPHTVVTAARDLPAGHVITPADVLAARVHDDVHPAGAVDEAAAVGRPVVRAVPAHSILTDASFSVNRDISTGERAVHVPVPDPGALRVVRPGDRIDLVEAGGGTVAASDVRVLAVDDPTTDDDAHGLLVAVPAGALPRLIPAMSSGGPGIAPALRTDMADGR